MWMTGHGCQLTRRRQDEEEEEKCGSGRRREGNCNMAEEEEAE